MSNRENVIEWLRDEETATVTLTQGRTKTKIMRLASEKPDECSITAINADGSMCAKIPTSWIKISPPRTVSEKQVETARERLIAYHANKNK